MPAVAVFEPEECECNDAAAAKPMYMWVSVCVCVCVKISVRLDCVPCRQFSAVGVVVVASIDHQSV